MLLRGLLLSLAAACTHTAIDTVRKCVAATVPSDQLVVLVYLLDAVICVTTVAASGGFNSLTFKYPMPFALVVASSSGLIFVAKFLYQRSLRSSPLSLTIPYLSFTPAILVLTAFVLLGEVPSFSGLCGVIVVTSGGYLLSMQGAVTTLPSSGALLATTHASELKGISSSSVAAAAAAAAALQHHMSSNGSAAQHHAGSSTASPRTVITLDGAACTAVGSEPKCLESKLATTTAAESALLSPRHPSRASYTGSVNGHGSAPLLPCTVNSCSTSGGGGNGTSNGGDGHHLHHHLHHPAIARSASLRGWAATLVASPLGAFAREPGSLMMLGVAALWSVTASLDKLGVMEAPSVAVYCAMQRGAIGVASLLHIWLLGSPRESWAVLRRHFWLLLSISCMELTAVVLYLLAVQHLLVSYVIAIKRSSILMSVLAGRVLFREVIGRRLPYVLLMLCGMTLIVIEPNASTAHHTQSAHG